MSKIFYIYLIFGIVIIVLTFGVVMKYQSHNFPTNLQTSQATSTTVSIIYNSNKPFTPQTTQVLQGSTVTIQVTSDIANELHFHGYDLHSDLEANKPGSITFTANQTGRFEFELEQLQKTLGYIEVYPK